MGGYRSGRVVKKTKRRCPLCYSNDKKTSYMVVQDNGSLWGNEYVCPRCEYTEGGAP